jgi:hypothetical protein
VPHPGGLLRIDAAKAKAEENLDGKYLLRTSDPTMSAEDIALGYKQLLQVEREWRDMKQVIELRPVHHRKEERIRAHVIPYWLALLLARVAALLADGTFPHVNPQIHLLCRYISSGTQAGRPATTPHRHPVGYRRATPAKRLSRTARNSPRPAGCGCRGWL